MSIVQIGLPLVLLTPFLLAPWIAFLHRHPVAVRREATAHATVESNNADPVAPCFAATFADLCAVLRDCLVAVDHLARLRWVRIETALDAATILPVDANVLRTALCDALLTAIDATPGGRVLVTAARSGSRVHIRVTDDGPVIDQRVRNTKMRPTEALIVSQGGSAAVDVRPGLGTTVTITLPMRANPGQPATEGEQAYGPMYLPVLNDQAA